jgi:hypothetical protein
VRIRSFAQIEGHKDDPIFEVLFHGVTGDSRCVEPYDNHVPIELTHLQALQLANLLIDWVTKGRERAECWVEAEKAAESAIGTPPGWTPEWSGVGDC